MKFVVSLLFIILQLIESTGTSLQLLACMYIIASLGNDMFAVGSCQLRVTVRENQDDVRETQLQLQCADDDGNCTMTNFTTCDTYAHHLNISTGIYHIITNVN